MSADTIRRAEGEYSRQRLLALSDEWHTDYPDLLYVVPILKRRPEIFPLSTVTRDEIVELCLDVATTEGAASFLSLSARRVFDDKLSAESFKRELFMVFFRIGLVGLKLDRFEGPSWVDELGQGVSPSEIDGDTRVVVHITYRRALGIRSN